MKTRSLFILQSCIVASILVSAGCSSRPSDDNGKQAIQERINKESQGRIRLNEFRKTNGVAGELAGMKVYKMEFEARIEFTSVCKWLTGGPLITSIGFATTPAIVGGNSLGQFLEDTVNAGQIVAQGQEVIISGEIHFVKKENGWAPETHNLRQANPVGGWKSPHLGKR